MQVYTSILCRTEGDAGGFSSDLHLSLQQLQTSRYSNFKLRKQLLLAVMQQLSKQLHLFPAQSRWALLCKITARKIFIQRSDEIKILNPN